MSVTPNAAPPIALNEVKLDQVLCYFLEQGSTDLGKTKLMKLLYYTDFGHYRNFKAPITGAHYEKWPQGPVAPAALEAIIRLKENGKIAPQKVRTGPYMQQSYIVQESVGDTALSIQEKSTVQAVWKRWKDASAYEIVEASHREAPWLSVQMWQPIPYHTALFS